jgi:DNA-3-methyladenine glycosylase II
MTTPSSARASRRRLPFSLARAYAHLRAADPVVGALIEEWGPYRPRPGADPWSNLVRTILFQQLAGSAARAIQRRFYALHGAEDRTPAPSEVLATSDEQFRAAGISRQKAAYLRDLAAHVLDDRLDFEALRRAPDAEVMAAITAVHGLGEWSAHMFLMFELGRPDVMPVGDLGVRAGMKAAYGLEAVPTPKEARAIGEPWTPYRSVGSWYMWRAVEGLVPEL